MSFENWRDVKYFRTKKSLNYQQAIYCYNDLSRKTIVEEKRMAEINCAH